MRALEKRGTGIDGDTLAAADVMVLAGGPESSAKALEMLSEAVEDGAPRSSTSPTRTRLLPCELRAKFPVVLCAAQARGDAKSRIQSGAATLISTIRPKRHLSPRTGCGPELS
jgi:hypothetical protein